MRLPIPIGPMLSVCLGMTFELTSHAASGVTPAGDSERVVYLDQGWSYEDRQKYYWTSQGSALLSYDIFLNLEQSKNHLLFRSYENVKRLGLVPQSPEPRWNPDGLPIGWTKASVTEGPWKGDWFGISCAACHNSQLEYKGTKIRIDGGNSTTFDLHSFLSELDEALNETLVDAPKTECFD